MNTEQCPCCGQNQELVGDGVLEAHYPPGGPRYGGMRSGSYCDGSGYTPDQARRWSALSLEQKREAAKRLPLGDERYPRRIVAGTEAA